MGALVPTATLRAAGLRDFRTLSTDVRAAGLLDRRAGYYSVRLVLTIAAFAVGWALVFVLGGSWWTLFVAVFLGVVATQLGFLGHDAGHRQIFESRSANRFLGLAIGNGLIGLSFGWWVPKHNAHHAHPNQRDRDPDIGVGLLGPPGTGEQAGEHQRLRGWVASHHAELFFPLMLLRSTGLYLSGIHDLLRRRGRTAFTEGVLLGLHAALYLTAVFWVFPPLMAICFVAVHQAVFSLYLGCSFAPNHKGMPLIDRDSEMGFARQQVITARNVSGGRCTAFVLGGLNYQIEHHLFPTMPRPNLARAQDLVRAFCSENNLAYCEERPIASYRRAIRNVGFA